MSEIYKLICFVFFIVTSLFVLRFHLETEFLSNRLCGHIDTVTAYKETTVTWNGKNDEGIDQSCYVTFHLNGQKKKQENWNIGNCSDPLPVEIRVNDYSCHS